MGIVIILFVGAFIIAIPVIAFWIALIGLLWSLWSISRPVPPSKRIPKETTPPLPPRRQQ